MILDDFRLDGQTALVTGCRRGIGLAFAEALAEAGADIIGVSANMGSQGEEVERRVNAAGRKFSGYACDFADRPAVYEFIRKIDLTGQRIDILVNNAGTVLRTPAAEHPDEYWDRVLEINLNSQFVLARHFGRAMLERGRGKIIFTASLITFQGGVNIPSYAASKGAIGQLTMALSNEWASRGVNVNAIAPGYITTDNTAVLHQDPERSAYIVSRIPAGRWGRPDDLKGAVVFLASRASDYVNGTILAVDGGWLGR